MIAICGQNYNPTTTLADATQNHIDDQSVYDYSLLLKSKTWNSFIKDPFNKWNKVKFIELISPNESTDGRKKLSHPIQYFGRL